MKFVEFKESFLTDFQELFPTDSEWLDKYPATLQRWFRDVFSGLGLEDCLATSSAISRGDVDGWGAFEGRQRIAAVYAQEVGRLRVERRQAEESEQQTLDQEYHRRNPAGIIAGDKSMSKALVELKRLTKAGASKCEQRDFLDQYFGDDDDLRDAKRCLNCDDTGFAMVYHPSVVLAAAQDKPIKHWKTVAVVCNCSAADSVASQTKRKKRLPVFGESSWHIAKNDPDGRAKCSMFDLLQLNQPVEARQPYKD